MLISLSVFIKERRINWLFYSYYYPCLKHSCTDAGSLILDTHLVALEGISKNNKDGEGNVNEADRDHDGVANLLHIVLVSLRYAECGCHLLPSEASVRHEDNYGEDVEGCPQR